MDPTFTAALSQVQADPMKALAMLESHPEMQKALQDLSGILGEHFTTLGNARSELVRLNLTAVFRASNLKLLTKSEVKMAGSWPSSFLGAYGLRRSRGL